MRVRIEITTDEHGDVEVEREIYREYDETLDGRVLADNETPEIIRGLIQKVADQAKLSFPGEAT